MFTIAFETHSIFLFNVSNCDTSNSKDLFKTILPPRKISLVVKKSAVF